MNPKAMYALSYGLFVVSTQADGKDNGCITNTAIQVTAEPNRIALAVNCANYTNELMKKAGMFNVSVLSEETVSVVLPVSAGSAITVFPVTAPKRQRASKTPAYLPCIRIIFPPSIL